MLSAAAGIVAFFLMEITGINVALSEVLARHEREARAAQYQKSPAARIDRLSAELAEVREKTSRELAEVREELTNCRARARKLSPRPAARDHREPKQALGRGGTVRLVPRRARLSDEVPRRVSLGRQRS